MIGIKSLFIVHILNISDDDNMDLEKLAFPIGLLLVALLTFALTPLGGIVGMVIFAVVILIVDKYSLKSGMIGSFIGLVIGIILNIIVGPLISIFG